MEFYPNGRDINMEDAIWKLRKSVKKSGISSLSKIIICIFAA